MRFVAITLASIFDLNCTTENPLALIPDASKVLSSENGSFFWVSEAMPVLHEIVEPVISEKGLGYGTSVCVANSYIWH